MPTFFDIQNCSPLCQSIKMEKQWIH